MAAAVGGSESEGPTVPTVLERMLRGAILAVTGKAPQRGIEMVAEAAEMEASMPYEFGPPVLVKPTYELLERRRGLRCVVLRLHFGSPI